MKKKLAVLTLLATLALGATADSAFAWGYSVLSSYTCPAAYPIERCNVFGTCVCSKT